MTELTDLVQRLRRDGIAARDTLKCAELAPTVDPEDAIEAADALEAQAKRIAELEAALKPFADAGHHDEITNGQLCAARKVLEAANDGL